MKAFALLLTAVLLVGCDVEKLTGIQMKDPTPTPAPVATPKPTPKPGDWMFKNDKNPLDPPKKK